MATRRIRHRGEQPADVDLGPASGSGQSAAIGAHAEVARLSAYAPSKLIEIGGKVPSGGAGAIERRMASEAQRAAWREADERVSRGVAALAFRETPAQIQAHRARGGESTKAGHPWKKRDDPHPPEEPAMSEPAPLPTPIPRLDESLAVLADALAEAIDAWETRQNAEERWQEARSALVASWSATELTVGMSERIAAVAELGFALGRVEGAGLGEDPEVAGAIDDAAVELLSIVTDSPSRRKAGNPGGHRVLTLDAVIASLRQTQGNREQAAKALGVARPSLDSFVATHDLKLPVDVRAAIDARRRK